MSSIPDYRLVQEREYMDRPSDRFICKTNASAKTNMIFGFFILLFSCFGYVVFLLAKPEGILWSPAANFILAIITIGYYTFKKGWKGNTEPRTPLSFDPKPIFVSQVFDFVNGIIFVISFLGFFLIFDEIGLSVIIGLIMTFVLGTMIYTFDDHQKVFLNNKIFGKSEIEILSPNLLLGETISIRFINDMLQENVDEVELVLRNIQEYWVTSKKMEKQVKEVKATIFYEEKHTIQIIGGHFDLDFEIPPGVGKPTNYAFNNPTYWELEVFNKETNYYSRFFIEVLPADEVLIEKSLKLKLKEKLNSVV